MASAAENFLRILSGNKFSQDVASLQQFIQSRQQLQSAENRLAGLRGLPVEQRASLQGPQFPAFTPFPQAQSVPGAQLFSNFLLNQQQQQAPFTLGVGQQRFQGGQAIAQVPARPVTPTKGSFQQITDPTTGRQINALVDLATGNIIKKFGAVSEGLSAKDKITIAVTQAKEFRADPRIKNLGIIERSEKGMAAALKLSLSPDEKSRIASDQALGVLFQKMLDPASVVRESEYARTPEGAAFINRVAGAATQLVRGGLRLKDEDRQALVTMAQKLLQEAKISANKAFDEFSVRADAIDLNKKIVFGGKKKFDISGEQLLSAQTLTPAEQTRLAELERLESQ